MCIRLPIRAVGGRARDIQLFRVPTTRCFRDEVARAERQTDDVEARELFHDEPELALVARRIEVIAREQRTHAIMR